jgi:hypothetical protein
MNEEEVAYRTEVHRIARKTFIVVLQTQAVVHAEMCEAGFAFMMDACSGSDWMKRPLDVLRLSPHRDGLPEHVRKTIAEAKMPEMLALAAFSSDVMSRMVEIGRSRSGVVIA